MNTPSRVPITSTGKVWASSLAIKDPHTSIHVISKLATLAAYPTFKLEVVEVAAFVPTETWIEDSSNDQCTLAFQVLHLWVGLGSWIALYI